MEVFKYHEVLIRNRFLIAKKASTISNFVNSLGCYNSLSSLLKIDLSNVFPVQALSLKPTCNNNQEADAEICK